MKFVYFGIVFVSFFTVFTTGFAFGDHLPDGFRTWAPAEGEECMSKEKTSWVKEKAKTEEGCVKVGYTVPLECGKWSNEWRSEKGMSDCQPPTTPAASSVPTPIPAPAPPTVYDFTEPDPAPVPMQSAQEDDYTFAIAAVSMIIIAGIAIVVMKQRKRVNSYRESQRKRVKPSNKTSVKMQQKHSSNVRKLERDMVQNKQREKESLTSGQREAKFEIEAWLVKNWTIVTLKEKTRERVDLDYIKEKLEKDPEMKKYLSVYKDWRNLLLEYERRFRSYGVREGGRDWHNRD
tara:strand:+ start:544 stop:1413 length:870 start_codon:yes stop_codon:yes gene_type:complete